jgi:hypothetical protein
MTIDDDTKWRSIERQAIQGDGKWVAYALQTLVRAQLNG